MCLSLYLADLWLRAIETNCQPTSFGRVEARFALTHVARPHRHNETATQPQPEPLFLADDGTYVDVTDFVRFELNHGDIRYGGLDLIVQFTYRGRRAQCYLLHFFPVDAVKENANTPFPEWTEGFEFPPALLKLRATVEGAIIPRYHQGCIAINTRGPQRMAQSDLGSVE